MTPIYIARISTMIAVLCRGWLRYTPYVISLACDRCGLNLDGRGEAGTSGSTFTIAYRPPNLLPFKLVVALTDAGRLSISCGCSQSDARPSDPPSGDADGTSCIRENSSALTCGCDRGAIWICERHGGLGKVSLAEWDRIHSTFDRRGTTNT